MRFREFILVYLLDIKLKKTLISLLRFFKSKILIKMDITINIYFCILTNNATCTQRRNLFALETMSNQNNHLILAAWHDIDRYYLFIN